LLNFTIGDDGSEQLPFLPERHPLAVLVGETRSPFAGDARVFENPMLGALHILFVREHNRIANELKTINPRWDDERLYQESRRILNAEYQHIIYNEWLPAILGNQFLKRTELLPLTDGFSEAYSNTFDPRVTNEFAAAAFRVGHTWIPDVIRVFDAISREEMLRNDGKPLFDLQNVFNVHSILRSGNLMDKILNGITVQLMQDFDNNFVEDITEHLFDEPDQRRGADLVAFNIQRARDHGLPSYVEYRDECLGYSTKSWDDLKNTNIPNKSIKKLQEVYENVEDIDLFIGAIQETPDDGDAIIGGTFLCLIGDMFGRMRFGDRFFYDNADQTGSFTIDQLNQIRKTSMSRLLCDNTVIERIQPRAFEKADNENNRLRSCESQLLFVGIPTVDLSVFKE